MKPFKLTIIFLVFAFSGCGGGSSSSSEPVAAAFEITGVSKLMKTYGAPYLVVTITNTGNLAAWNVSCDVYAKMGNTYVDDSFLYFLSGGTINPGESAIDDTIFFALSSHSDYDDIVYQCSWIEVD